MSYVRVWVHAVFTTKYRKPTIIRDFRQSLFEHMVENAREKEIKLIIANGYVDHVHCLISLNKELSISKTLQLIKGESSYWVNKNNISPTKFAWQDDYWAAGVSESHLKSVTNYIRNQEQHHAKQTFSQEIETFKKSYGWSWQER